jgi:hypothetical protein
MSNTKPTPKERKPILDFHEVIRFIEKKHKIDVRDYAGKFKGGSMDDKPYLDYWHWLIENHFYDVNNGCERHWDIKFILEGDGPDWVKEITQLVYDEFKDNLDKDGGVDVNIWW